RAGGPARARLRAYPRVRGGRAHRSATSRRRSLPRPGRSCPPGGTVHRAPGSARDGRRVRVLRAVPAGGAVGGPRRGAGAGRPVPGTTTGVEAPALPGMTDAELMVADIWATGLSPDSHPVQSARELLTRTGVVSIVDLARSSTGGGCSSAAS